MQSEESMIQACKRAQFISESVDEPFQQVAFAAVLGAMLAWKQDKPTTNHESITGQPRSKTVVARKPRVGKARGLTSQLRELIEEGYFSTGRTVRDVTAHLEVGGWHHESKHVAARLQELTQKRALKRSNAQGDSYAYVAFGGNA